jgi:hypothetical protein
MVDVPVQGFRKYLTLKLASLNSECHAITDEYLEEASVVQQVYKMLGDIENLSGCTLVKVRESSELTYVENASEENRANFCKVFCGKLLSCALCGMYTVTLTELKATPKVSA